MNRKNTLCALAAALFAAHAQPTTDPTQIIVVTATRHATALVDAPAAMNVVTSEQIAERGADNVFEALRGETSLSLQGRTIGGRTVLSLRGMKFRHTLFLVDGKRVGGTDGVVNIITRRPGSGRSFGAHAEGRYGDDSLGGDGHRAAARASGPLAKGLRVAVSMADTQRQALTLKEGPQLTELEGRRKQDGALQLWWTPTAGHEIETPHRAGAEDHLSVLPQPGPLFTGGFEGRDEKLFNDGLPGSSGQARHHALYAQGEFDAGPALALTAGLRHDRHERFGREWSPRAYAVWRAAPGWVVKGGFGHGFKAPSLKQISPDYREDEGPHTYFGNAALVPERSDAAELGIGWDTVAGGAQAMAFYSRVENLIVPRLLRRVGTRGEYLFENIDRARFQGVETAVALRLPAGSAVNATCTSLDARDDNAQRLEKRPRHSLGLRLNWRDGPWRAGLNTQYSGGQVLASTTPGQGPQRAPDLTRMGAQVSRELDHGLTLSAGVDNLGQLRLAEESPLFTGAEPPRTWRIALRGQW